MTHAFTPPASPAALPSSPYWADWTWTDFATARLQGVQPVAVLPLGATEQHGPHLPLQVDTCLVDGVVQAAVPHVQAQQTTALFLPTQAVGFSPEHMAYPGTLSLSATTIIRLWTELGEGVHRAGVQRLVLFNAHGGQVGLLDTVARDLRARLGMLVFSVNWYGLPLTTEDGHDANAMFSAHEHRFGIHAGDVETSMMLALRPDLVRMQAAQQFASASEQRAAQYPILGNGKSAKLAWQMQDYNPAGAVGNAAAATADKGRSVLAAAGRALAVLLAEVHSLPASTISTAAPNA
ncbi:creatininase family protein [Curvibacter sp. CHRR-16]|uniref:creatininase family protein n=1 Tax=Curvibacter sp. CHRR-16 TaxID=2835872 RepID=UPI001BD94CDE|nr:creatininase family protein [Curvibacter sp. CHRR-16]MBT0569855.1 creatininase family protein [Curvibacter sp. CHRR-16]